MLGDIGSMIRLNEMAQSLRSDPPENNLILIMKKPLSKKKGKRVCRAKNQNNDCCNKQSNVLSTEVLNCSI